MSSTAVTLDATVFDAFLKEIYPQVRVEGEAFRKAALMEWLPKFDDWYGDAYVVPVLYENAQGHSRTISEALLSAETTRQVKFVGTSRVKDYGVVSIGGEVMMAASKDVGSFVRARETQINSMLNQLGKRTNIGLYRDPNGYIGVIASGGVSGNVMTLTKAADIYNFGIGQTLISDDTITGASPHNSGATMKVTNLSVSAKTVTVDSIVSGTAAGDYLFNSGDQSLGFHGLASWLPLTAPDSTSFLSVDRSLYVERLGGKRLDNSTRTILENAQELAMLIGEDGGEPDTLWMHPRSGKILAEEIGVKVERMEGGQAKLGWSGFRIENFVTGPIEVRFDRDCDQNRAYLLQKNTWRLAHMGPLPHLIRDDSLTALRSASADSIQVRARLFGDLFCEAPGWNGVMSVASLS